MKMAKASKRDLDAAVALCHLVDGLTSRWGASIPAASENCEDIQFDIENHEHCKLVVERIQSLFNLASLQRVVMGMLVLMDPDNMLIDPDADTLEFHPAIVAAIEKAKADTEAA